MKALYRKIGSFLTIFWLVEASSKLSLKRQGCLQNLGGGGGKEKGEIEKMKTFTALIFQTGGKKKKKHPPATFQGT